jgi:hypothetical protein
LAKEYQRHCSLNDLITLLGYVVRKISMTSYGELVYFVTGSAGGYNNEEFPA